MESERPLRGGVVCVTGSARRVGRTIALAFAEAGAHLVIHHASASSEADARRTAREVAALGGDAIVVQGDQARKADVETMFERIRSHYGRLDVMVNSAAIFQRGELLELSEADWDRVLATNLKGPFLLTQAAGRLMQGDDGGVIINISDNSGLYPWPARPHHSVSKAGVIMLTRVAALALAPHRIRVNCVVPGPVLVPADADDAVLDEIAAALPLGRIGTPRNVADACIFLATNDFATGTVLRVDGGEALAAGTT